MLMSNDRQQRKIYLYYKEIKSNTLILKQINKVLAAYNNHNS